MNDYVVWQAIEIDYTMVVLGAGSGAFSSVNGATSSLSDMVYV